MNSFNGYVSSPITLIFVVTKDFLSYSNTGPTYLHLASIKLKAAWVSVAQIDAKTCALFLLRISNVT